MAAVLVRRVMADAGAVLDAGALLPFAGPKGASAAFMVETLVAALGGGASGFEAEDAAIPGAATSRTGHFLLLTDPAAAGARVSTLLAAIGRAGNGRLPAERRYAARQKAERDGIPVSPAQLAALRWFAGEHGATGRPAP